MWGPFILATTLIWAWAGFAGAQTGAAPRTISDITAILDQQKPDPARVAQAREGADRELPQGAPPRARFGALMERARARGLLGRQIEQREDLRMAIEISRRAGFDGNVAFNALAILENTLGFPKLAYALRQEQLRGVPESQRGRLFSILGHMSRVATVMGDFEKGREHAREADRLLGDGFIMRSPNYHVMEDDWRGQVARAEAFVSESEGKWQAAEQKYRETITLIERMLAKGDSVLRSAGQASATYTNLLAHTQYDLARVLRHQNRLAEAEAEARRGLLGALRSTDKYNVTVLQGVNLMGSILQAQARWVEAEKMGRAGLEIADGIGLASDAQLRISATTTTAAGLQNQGKVAEALQLHEEIRHVLPVGPSRRRSVVPYALALMQAGRPAEAAPLLKASSEEALARYGDKDYDTAELRALYATALVRAGALDAAAVEFKAAMPILLQTSRQTDADESGGLRDQRLSRVSEGYMLFLAQIRGTPAERTLGIDAVAESFRMGDAARGQSVQRALAASSARAATRNPKLADLARTEQDAQKQIGAQFALLNSILASPPEQQDSGTVRNLRRSIDRLRDERAKARERIEREFPNYAQLVDPRPATLVDARRSLRPGEALIATFVGRDHTFVWAIPHAGAPAFNVIAVGSGKIARTVEHLRRALDPNAASLEEVPAFDVAAAYQLFTELLLPVEAGWKGASSLLVVADRQLGQLPFGLMVTEPATVAGGGPLFAGYRNVPFLIRKAAITQVPSVAALAALRALPAPTANRLPFIGFGDPWFSREQAGEARAQQAALQTRGRPLVRRSAPATRSVDTAELGLLPRLPDTADEVRSIAMALRADPVRDVILGAQANEQSVRTADLANRRIVMFATHGLIPGDLNGLSQPALALSAPNVADVDGDGLLTMDEILELKLDADWVVLSACNTAAGDGAGAEAVSGLGRAFFYAGTRALLVSNWPVETTSARLLTTDLFARQSADPALPRAVAMQQAMLGLIDGPGVEEGGKTVFSYAHPIFWAPFSVVGDGG